MYLRVIEAAVPPPADGLESTLLSLGGGTLAGRGHGALVMMTDEMAGYLDTLAGGRPANGAAADPLTDVLDRLARRLRNADAWSALLSAGTRKPATLGLRLIPLLRSGHGQILRVDPASRAAAGLIRAVAPTLDDDEHRRLEAEVVGIPATGYTGHLRDRLLGALDRSRISDPGAKERLAALDAAAARHQSKARLSVQSGTSRWPSLGRAGRPGSPRRRRPCRRACEVRLTGRPRTRPKR